MENLENMEAIEAAQTELGYFLVSMMPVPWLKICLYAKCAPGYASVWYAFVEEETGVVSVQDFFWDRYSSYPVDELDAVKKLSKLTLNLYKAYLERFGEEKIWKAVYYTLNSDGTLQIDFDYESSNGNSFVQRDAVYERFFHTAYKYYTGKYPSTEYEAWG